MYLTGRIKCILKQTVGNHCLGITKNGNVIHLTNRSMEKANKNFLFIHGQVEIFPITLLKHSRYNILLGDYDKPSPVYHGV